MFNSIKKKVQDLFAEYAKQPEALFWADIDKDKVWEIYLNSFAQENRQEHTCNCCKSFLRQFSGVVYIKDNKIHTIWDFDPQDEEYNAAIKNLADYVRSLPVTDIFLTEVTKCGTDKTPDSKRNLVWQHFFFEAPKVCVIKKDDIGAKLGTARDNKNVLQRSLNEIKEDAVNTTLELIAQNSLYRGNEFQKMVSDFSNLQKQYKKIKNNREKECFCWTASKKVSQAVARINNSAIGTLLKDLSEGRDLDQAVSAFERVVAPANYKRPTALVTPRMIEQAQKRLVELGLVSALERRQLSTVDLNVNNSIYVHRTNVGEKNIFDQLKKDVTINPKSYSKVEEVNIGDFVNKILPTAKSVSVLVENSHLNNFVSLIGPKEKDSGSLFKWGNDVSWSYAGEVADSVKERVKTAGGKVDGYIRISLSWSNHDDLDLHLIEPKGNEIYFANRGVVSRAGGVLDVDMNAGSGTTRQPVENICYSGKPKDNGEYKVVIHQYNKRESQDTGFTVEIECEGNVSTFFVPDNGSTGKKHEVFNFNYSHENGVTFKDGNKTSKYPVKEKWGIKTGQFHKVKAISLSPNHWNGTIGNKHYMFFLDKCVSDEKVRPFYNEFLKEELAADRKVFELLGSKVEVEKPQDELSGIGFSDTQRNSFLVEVEGAFKRVIRVNV